MNSSEPYKRNSHSLYFSTVTFILNFIFPGVGTMVASCYDVKGFNFQQFWIGILQAFTCFLIIGWIWSIWWGYQIVDRANDDDFVPLEEKEKFDKDHSHNA